MKKDARVASRLETSLGHRFRDGRLLERRRCSPRFLRRRHIFPSACCRGIKGLKFGELRSSLFSPLRETEAGAYLFHCLLAHRQGRPRVMDERRFRHFHDRLNLKLGFTRR